MNRVDQRFASMGSQARVRLQSAELSGAELERLAARARATIDGLERALSRFDPASELCALNRDPRPVVPVSPAVAALARAAVWAHEASGGLVDATLLDAVEDAGYRASRAGQRPAPLSAALAAAPSRRPATTRGPLGLAADDGRVRRAPGVRIDSGGLAKGMAADAVSAQLPPAVRYAIACGGDLALGGGGSWGVAVRDLAGAEIHRLAVSGGGVATSGIGGRIWQNPDGAFAHHLLDPGSGVPAWTGLTAVTAVAASALEAEVLAKTALLSGPRRARHLLVRGGVLQHDDGRVEIVEPRPVVSLAA
jgi:thiamine biosynthesis lipoprotein